MKAFVFKPTNEFIGKFDVASLDDVPTEFEKFLADKKVVAPFSYVEVSGKTWTIVSQQPLRLQDGTVKERPTPEQPPDTAPLPVARIFRAIIGFIVGAGLTLVILAAIFEGMGSATGRHYSPRGGGWFFLIIGIGVGCARLFMAFDQKFVQSLPLQARVMVGMPISWVVLVLSFVWVFQPFGRYFSDDEKWLVAKIVAFPIVVGFLACFGYAALFKKCGKPDAS